MYKRLLNFINKYNILYKYQFGFRKNHSTSMALMTIVDKISEALQNKQFVLGVFLDLSKAFDTVDNEILCQKLQYYGIRGLANDWIKSYLSNRSQYVYYNNTSSTKLSITCGVHQGSILGPLLFLLYINDIANVSDIIFSLLFADDTSVFIQGDQLDDIANKMNIELKKLVAWLNTNKLSLNIDKTQYMIFSTYNRKLIKPTKLEINDNAIKQVSSTTFIGVTIDNKLNWAEHINRVKCKISKGVGIINKAKRFLTRPCLVTLYYSFVFPHLTYCIEVWGGAFDSYCSSIIKVQQKAVRMLVSANISTHPKHIFKLLNILTFRQLCVYSIQMFMYKYNSGLLPNIFGNMFKLNQYVHRYNTRQSTQIHISLATLEIRLRSVRIKGGIIWNYFNTRLKFTSYSIINYKCILKPFILYNDVNI